MSYGAYSKIYLDLKHGPDGKLIIYDNTGYSWAIMANGQIGDELQLISTPEQYYFYIPAFGEQDAMDEFTIRAKKNLDLTQHPAIKNYIGYFQPSGISMWHKMVVILIKNNELPYVQITKGEYIDQMSAAVVRKYVAEKEYAINSWPEGKTRLKLAVNRITFFDMHLFLINKQHLQCNQQHNHRKYFFDCQLWQAEGKFTSEITAYHKANG